MLLLFGIVIPLFIMCLTVEPVTKAFELRVMVSENEFLSSLSYNTINKLEMIAIYYELGGKVRLDRYNYLMFRRYFLETRGREINE